MDEAITTQNNICFGQLVFDYIFDDEFYFLIAIFFIIYFYKVGDDVGAKVLIDIELGKGVLHPEEVATRGVKKCFGFNFP